MDEDLETLTENTEVRLWSYCNRLDRSNKAVNTEIENLLNYAQRGQFKYGTFEVTDKRIKQNCNFCKELLKVELQLIRMVESTLLTLNVGKLLKK